jgi:hypothetical protein
MLPKQGVYFFKVKILKSSNNHIILGACSKDVCSLTGTKLYQNNLNVGLSLTKNMIFGSNQINIPVIIYVKGKSIFKVVIDMNKKQISWYWDNNLLQECYFWREM